MRQFRSAGRTIALTYDHGTARDGLHRHGNVAAISRLPGFILTNHNL